MFEGPGYQLVTSGHAQGDGFDWIGMAVRSDVGFNRIKMQGCKGRAMAIKVDMADSRQIVFGCIYGHQGDAEQRNELIGIA